MTNLSISRSRWRVYVGGAAALAVPALATAAIELPHVFESGDEVRASDFNENFQALVDALDTRVIRDAQTIDVAANQGCDAIVEAIASLDEHSIGSTGSVSIALGAGTYNCSQTIEVGHPDGQRISLVGEGTVDDVELVFADDVSGIRVRGSALRTISNLTLTGTNPSTSVGIDVDRASTISSLTQVHVSGFYSGVQAIHSSVIMGVSDLSVADNVLDGLVAARVSTIRADNVTATGNGRDGFRAVSSSSLTLATGCSASSNGASGYYAGHGSTVYAPGAISQSNGANGFTAALHSSMYLLPDVTATDNAGVGLSASENSYLEYGGAAVLSGNDGGETNITPNAPDPVTGAVVRAR